MNDFPDDPRPGAPRVLFIGHAESTHTHAWLDLLRDAPLNVRLFALPTGLPPADWPVRTYVTAPCPLPATSGTRVVLFPVDTHGRRGWYAGRRRLFPEATADAPQRLLAHVLKAWQPQLVHVLGLDPAGYFLQDTLRHHPDTPRPRWVLQLRGGSDLTLTRHDPDAVRRLVPVLQGADCLLSDNRVNIEYAAALGVPATRFASLVPVPGTGGVDVAALAANATTRPAARRVIVWPKAYHTPWTQALPVFEALRRCAPLAAGDWTVHALAAAPELHAWYWTLPDALRARVHLQGSLPRPALLRLLADARVMLAPSLVDGVPNTLYEAMATGAFPIVSPLPTITPVVQAEQHVLFARNLDPDEIAAALARALTDDALVDAAATRNLALVRSLADRTTIRPRVLAFYADLTVAAR